MSRYLGVVGSMLVTIGVFLPIVSSTALGSKSLITGTDIAWQGYTLFVIGVAGVIMFYRGRGYTKIVAVIADIGVVLFFVLMYMKIKGSSSGALTQMIVALGGVSLGWGWAILFVGAILMTVASLIKIR